MLEFGGDFGACARELGRRGYGNQVCRRPAAPDVDVAAAAAELVGRVSSVAIPANRRGKDKGTAPKTASTANVEARNRRFERKSRISERDELRYQQLKRLINMVEVEPKGKRSVLRMLNGWYRAKKSGTKACEHWEIMAAICKLVNRDPEEQPPERELEGSELAVCVRDNFVNPTHTDH